ncbi:UNVERIFIED_CONTAM: LacI family DNA-binding transcriptional regulator [Halobacillus marinus]|uniref:LacI family DNA-binding transcriptional regulator n=1 Tax=Bacillaceae TaxID=186817 RepID=UPI0002A4CF5D|nr:MULTISPECIES: LacI family DNA-binding transcriptional regulator [Bacillaceae]ELK49087.1 LacI family transcriptional regulator [Halobacillus sp. BAB-2008]QHT48120.1 LacI family transcriptional regulator [Bacillus sp. SB49]
MSVTIKDVAKKANVAPSTVSRVISDSPRISEKTKRKVRKVMEELGYHLNYNGRVLVSQSTQTIGIVTKVSSIHSFDNPFFSELLRGISDACHDSDYSIYLTTGNTEEAIYKEVVKMVQGKRVDGCIVLYSREDDKVVPYLRECEFPFVMIGKPVDSPGDTLYVDNDNVQASKDATNHLIKLGHEKLGFIGGDAQYEVARDRLQGFKQALQANGLDETAHIWKNIQADQSGAEEVAAALTALSDPPTGLVITDDYNAMMVMRELTTKGWKLPEQMSVIGFNNTMIARLSSPPLTTVDTQSFQLGHESARNLIEWLKHPDRIKKSVIIPTIIIERESCSRKSPIRPS